MYILISSSYFKVGCDFGVNEFVLYYYLLPALERVIREEELKFIHINDAVQIF